MLQKIRFTLQQTYDITKKEYLKEQITKLDHLIFERRDIFPVNDKKKHLVVHILNDSPYNHSFIKTIEANLTEKSEVTHKFYFYGNHLKHMDESQYKHSLIKITSITQELLSDLQDHADMILMQYLFPYWMDIFSTIQIKGILAWMPWGGDYMGYGLNEFFDHFDIEYCRQYGIIFNNEARVWNDVTKQKFTKFLSKVSVIFGNIEMVKILQQQHSHMIWIDYIFPQNYQKEGHLVPIQDEYLSIYQMILDQLATQDVIKIVLGNSSTPENNHFSALKHLKEVEMISNKLFFVTIILSYGNTSAQYKEVLTNYAIELFGDRCFIFEQFLNTNDFLNFVSLQDIAYMNHIRSQGFGAINLYLLHNVDVFIRPSNLSYTLLKHFENSTNQKIDCLHSTNDFFAIIQEFEKKTKYFNNKNLDIFEMFFNQSIHHLISILC